MNMKGKSQMNRKTKKGMVLALALCLLSALSACGTARADVVYATDAGTLGHIEYQADGSLRVQPSRLSGLGAGTSLFAFEADGRAHVLTVAHDAAGDKLAIYDVAEGWTSTAQRTLTGINDVHGFDVSQNGRGLFAAGWNAASNDAMIFELRTDNDYAPSGNAFVCPVSDNYSAQAVKVSTRSYELYGLFSISSVSGDVRAPSKLICMDGRLIPFKGISSWDVGANATNMIVVDNDVVIAHETGIDVYTVGSNQVNTVFTSNLSGDATALCEDGDRGFYFVGRGAASAATLYRRDRQGTVATVRDLGAAAVAPQLAWDKSEKLLVLMMGNGITIFDKDGALLREFSTTELGGVPVSIATLRSASSDDDHDSRSCSASGLGAFAALILPLVLLRDRKRR